jgi:hypothetical protein
VNTIPQNIRPNENYIVIMLARRAYQADPTNRGMNLGCLLVEFDALPRVLYTTLPKNTLPIRVSFQAFCES